MVARMRRLRGPRRGERLTPHQFANNWISADGPDGRPVIVRPLSVSLDPEDVEFFQQRLDSAHVGFFWRVYTLDVEGRVFRRRSSS